MKKLLSLVAVAGIAFSVAAPAAMADQFVARYTYLVNGAAVPTAAQQTTVLTQPAVLDSCNTGCNTGCGQVLTQPAVLDSCNSGCGQVLTQPAVLDSCNTGCNTGCGNTLSAVSQRPILVEHHENLVPHLFHLGVWPLVDFSIF